MAYECGYEGGYTDDCGGPVPPVNFCAPIGWGGGSYGLLVYAGYELCSGEIAVEVLPTPRSNVRNICIVWCN